MSIRKIASVIAILLLVGTIQLTADTIIDTTYSVAEMDGGIGYNTLWGTYGIGTIGALIVGDWL